MKFNKLLKQLNIAKVSSHDFNFYSTSVARQGQDSLNPSQSG